jgi:hypothetical protein
VVKANKRSLNDYKNEPKEFISRLKKLTGLTDFKSFEDPTKSLEYVTQQIENQSPELLTGPDEEKIIESIKEKCFIAYLLDQTLIEYSSQDNNGLETIHNFKTNNDQSKLNN